MVWRVDGPQGDEAAKVRLDVFHYMAGRVLDIGCGPAKVFPHVVGVDSGIDQKRFGIPVRADIPAEATKLDTVFAESSFDCVFSSHTLELIDDYKLALAQWWRLVKPGGTLILYLPHKQFYPNIGQPGANPYHRHDFLPRDVQNAMRELGAVFDLEVNEERNGGVEYSFLQVYRKIDGNDCRQSWKRPKPEKTCAVVRLGAYGDALMGASVLPWLKEQGYHITLYTEPSGREILKHDPHIDEFRVQPVGVLDGPMQIAYWLNAARKFDQFINLVGSIERRLLPLAHDQEFYLPKEIRQRVLDKGYLESIHEFAGVPFPPRQKFYPTPAEMADAALERAKFDGPVVVINPGGSTPPKWWPHVQPLVDLLVERGMHPVIVGDLRGNTFDTHGRGAVIGTDWPIRKACAFATLADVVVGEESALVNATAFEPEVLKIVLLSHSTNENLTKHWPTTLALESRDVACYPCHQIHHDWQHCTRDPATGAALCQATITPDVLLAEIERYFTWRADQQKAAA